MMRSFSLFFPVVPVAKERPRYTKSGISYTPTKTKNYERQIKKIYQTNPKSIKFEEKVPLEVNLEFGMPIPKSTSKKKRLSMIAGEINHTKTPDIDNLIKAVFDGLSKSAWADDSQIVRVSAKKKYAKEPYVYLYVHEYMD